MFDVIQSFRKKSCFLDKIKALFGPMFFLIQLSVVFHDLFEARIIPWHKSDREIGDNCFYRLATFQLMLRRLNLFRQNWLRGGGVKTFHFPIAMEGGRF